MPEKMQIREAHWDLSLQASPNGTLGESMVMASIENSTSGNGLASTVGPSGRHPSPSHPPPVVVAAQLPRHAKASKAQTRTMARNVSPLHGSCVLPASRELT